MKIGLTLSSITDVITSASEQLKILMNGSEEPSLSAAGRSLHWKMKQRRLKAPTRRGALFFQAFCSLKFTVPFYAASRTTDILTLSMPA